MIIFDTQTTGLRLHENQICQLTYIKLDANYNREYAKNFYFSVNRVEPGALAVHGLSVERLEKLSNGNTFKDFAEEIYGDFIDCESIIAHNIDFDLNFLWIEMIRAGYKGEFLREKKHFCTMLEYTDIMRLDWCEYEDYKSPTLNELSYFLGLNDDAVISTAKDTFQIDNKEEISFNDSRVDIIVAMTACKCYEKIQKLEKYRKLCWHIEVAQKYIDRIKNHVGFNEFEDLNHNELIPCIEHSQEFFNKPLDDEHESLVEKSAKRIMKILMKASEIERVEREKVAGLKEEEPVQYTHRSTIPD